MDKESVLELQKLDCNCNDCAFLVRDIEALKRSQELHRTWQENHFNITKNNLLEKAKDWDVRGEKDKAANVRKEANKLKFQFDKKEASINYGQCQKFNKKVSFIPNTLQLETQDCFKHRREN